MVTKETDRSTIAEFIREQPDEWTSSVGTLT